MSVAAQQGITYSTRNRRKQLQYFFNYLKHAKNCQRGRIKNPVMDSYRSDLCKLELCKYVDLVVSHKTLMDCRSSESCNSNLDVCSSSSKLLSHCEHCSDFNCFICPFLRGTNPTHGSVCDETKDSISELKEHHRNLDLLCMLNDEEEITYCSCGEPIVATNLNYMDCNSACNKMHLPAGLIIENEKSAITEGSKSWHSTITPEQRNNLISGFLRTIITKTDKSVLADKRLFYFLAFVSMFEKEIYESSDSKAKYITTLLEKIKEIDEEFKNYRREEKKLSVQDAAENFFKGKIGNNGLTKAELPSGLTYILGEPKPMLHKDKKSWQNTLDPSYREAKIFKWCRVCDLLNCEFTEKSFYFLLEIVELETTVYNTMKSEEEYSKINYWFKNLEKSSEKLSDNNGGLNVVPRLFSTVSAFCYSHYLLLTYSVTYQLYREPRRSHQNFTF